jgi:lysophospholipase L1-like esterase
VLAPGAEKPQAGWGQLLHEFFDARVTVRNQAIGGRTARRFVLEGRLDALLGTLQRGDYLFVQFGTNDSNKTATYTIGGTTYPYYAAAASDFKTFLQPFIDGARATGAIPVLVTPPPRNTAYCGGPRSLGDYGQAMLEVGEAQSLPVLDLGKAAHAHLSAICPKPANGAAENFFKVNADGTIDGTHFQLTGARTLARLIAEAVDDSGIELRESRLR